MDVSLGVIDSVNIRFQKKGQSEACSSRPAKIFVSDTGKIEITSLEDKPILLTAKNVVKPRRPRNKNSTWITLDILQNVEAKLHYVNIQANSRSELDSVYDTLMIAWPPKQSDLFNDDDSFAATDPVYVPPPIKKQTLVDSTAGGGRSARANITVEPEGGSLLGFNTDFAKPSSSKNRKSTTSEALKRMFDDYGIGNGPNNSRSSNGLSPYDQYVTEIAALPKEKSLTRKATENLFDTKFGRSNTAGNPINTGNNQTVLSNSSKPAPTPRLFVPEKNLEGKRVLELTAELEEVHTQWAEQNAKNASKIRQLKRQLEDERQFSANLLVRETIVLDDADEPPVKRRAEDEESASSPEVAEIRQQLKQSEEKFQKLCDVARRDKEALQARVDFLETLVDSKDGILNKPDDASVDDELKKQLGEVSKELEEERQRSTKLKKDNELIKGQLLQFTQQLQQSISAVLESSEVLPSISARKE